MLAVERPVVRHAGAASMTPVPLRVAIVEPDANPSPLHLVPGGSAEVVMRIGLVPEDVERLVASGVALVIVDLRRTCSTQIRPALRLLRLLVRDLRVVAVTDAGDDAAAQIAIASGAVAHVSRDPSPMGLLRAVNAASRGTPHLGETGQRAVRRMQRDGE